MRKKISKQIRKLIENSVMSKHRCIFLILGDRAKEQIINIYNLWNTIREPEGKPNLLWCFNKELGFSSYQEKRRKQMNKMIKQGLYEKQDQNPFENFLSSLSIRYCYYKETQNILGSTFDMLILQDFEALTPNTLCQTIETVQGGGMVFFILNSMKTLKNIFTMTMNIHKRFRTEAFANVKPLFNERMILSLALNEGVLFLDDELNLLPVSQKHEQLEEQGIFKQRLIESQKKQEDLVNSLSNNKNIFNILKFCKTFDQAKIVLKLLDCIRNQNFQEGNKLDVKFISAGRGRGKSASLGLSIAGALLYDCHNVYLSAATPENMRTVFEFVEKGLEQFGFQKNLNFTTKVDENKNPTELILFTTIGEDDGLKKVKFQKVMYIQPGQIPSNPDLLVIDEAAAIPLTVLKPMVFNTKATTIISSTIHGYEGTGRSLSLKLIEDLRKNNNTNSMRILEEMTMEIPIRYNVCDPVENWLNTLLCLDCSDISNLQNALPYPEECTLYLVNKETLFSFNKSSEQFLKKIWSLFVSSHYKNSPNDLQLFSDAPAHCLAVLLGPLQKGSQSLPDVLVAIQFCFEGKISQETVNENNNRGIKPSGDLIPWGFSEQFLNKEIFKDLGIRIVRIATHKKAQGGGFGSKALKELENFFENKFQGENRISFNQFLNIREFENESEDLAPRKNLQPLLKKLTQIEPYPITYMSVSYGMSKQLFKFWNKNGYKTFYVKHKFNEQTGEHTCMMMKPLQNCQLNLEYFFQEYRKRFISLLPLDFNKIDLQIVLDLVEANVTSKNEQLNDFESKNLALYFTSSDLQRLEAYANNKIDHFIIKDLIPQMALLFFKKNFPENIKLSFSQAMILIGLALQNRSMEEMGQILKIEHNQILALYNKTIRRLMNSIKEDISKQIEGELGFVKKDVETLPLNLDAQNLIEDLLRKKKIGKKQLIQTSQFFIINDQNGYSLVSLRFKTFRQSCIQQFCIIRINDVNSKENKMGKSSRLWLYHSLKELQKSLDQKLVFYIGDPLQIIPQLIQEFKVEGIYYNRCYEPWRRERDSQIELLLKNLDVHIETFNGSLLWEPEQVLKEDGTSYKVFTPFYRECLKSGSPREPLEIPENIQLFDTKKNQTIPILNKDEFQTKLEKTLKDWKIGEQGAMLKASQFVSNEMQNYKNGRNLPSKKFVSKMSPHLHFGEISPNQLWFMAKKCKPNFIEGRDMYHSELAWREFTHSLLYFYPHIVDKNFQEKFDEYPWTYNKNFLEKWQSGQTGYPMVDAGMRELNQTGNMHNRLRMITASFLIKNLGLHWKEGERYFWDKLLDANLAQNAGNWQWVAGSGADPSPFFRVFNVVTQGQKFDKKGEYVKKYCPELKNLPLKYLFDPSQAPSEILKEANLVLGKDYPMAIVDLQKTREIALINFKKLPTKSKLQEEVKKKIK